MEKKVMPKVGQRVRHDGTRMWGTVLEVYPHTNGESAEIFVRYEQKPSWTDSTTTFWASYHIDRVEDA